jgi:hypothetical protein
MFGHKENNRKDIKRPSMHSRKCRPKPNPHKPTQGGTFGSAPVSGKKRDVRKPAEAKKKVNSQAAVGYVDRKSSRAIL